MIKANVSSRPIHYAWDIFNENITGQCMKMKQFYIVIGSVNVFLNVVLFLLVRSCGINNRRPRGLMT